MSKVSVIIVNYNGEELISSCLRSLEEQAFRDFDIIVIDNASTDRSLYKINKFSEKSTISSSIKVVTSEKNIGFAGGNNKGLEYAGGDYIALLNNDTEADAQWLKELVNVMDVHRDVGICASKMVVYGTNSIDSAGDGYATWLKGFKKGEGEDKERFKEQEYVFGACAGAVLYRREMLEEIDFFDEDFFIIHEDTDLNFRAQLAGWNVMYVPTAVIYHKVRSTIGHMSETAIYYTLRNNEFVRIKNTPLFLFLRCLPEFVLGIISEFIYFVFKYRQPGLYLKAKVDVIKKLRSMLSKRRKIMQSRKVSNEHLYDMMTPVWNREFFSAKMKNYFLNKKKSEF